MSECRTDAQVVVVGAGMAGVTTAVQLREQGWRGPVRLVGEETHPPYDRPPLSKAVLLGTAENPAFDVDFATLDVDLRLGVRATGLDTGRRVLHTDDGPVPYDQLVLATGAHPRPLPGGEDVPGVHLLRTLDDAARLRPVLKAAADLVVVGAGWIGAEFTTAALQAGCSVTVLEAGQHPLAGVLPVEVAEPMRAWYEDAGARLRTSTAVASVEAGAVLLADGERLAADAVLVGIGARPATDWLRGSGVRLAPDGSVECDARLRTSAPGVWAVGDCASFPSARYRTRLLVHHWDNALNGPRVLAANLAAGSHADAEADREDHDPVPYFWSEQFGRFLQYAGHHTPQDTLVWRGDPSEVSWTVCWVRDERLRALLAVGRPRDLTQGRRVVEAGAVVDPLRLEDPSVPLKRATR